MPNRPSMHRCFLPRWRLDSTLSTHIWMLHVVTKYEDTIDHPVSDYPTMVDRARGMTLR